MPAPEVHVSAGQRLTERRPAIAQALVAREFAARPELAQRYGPTGRAKALQDALYHLAFLAQSLELDCKELFHHYVGWAKVLLERRQVRAEDLAFHLEQMADVVRQSLAGAEGELAAAWIAEAGQAMPGAPVPEGLPPTAPPLTHEYLAALLAADKKRACDMVLAAVQGGLPVQALYLGVLQPVMHEVGRLWQLNEITVAQEHFCAAVTESVMSQLYPYITRPHVGRRTMVSACVGGELHQIGARMVAELFELAGWDAMYLGASTPAGDLLRMLVQQQADVFALSCTFAPNLHEVTALVAATRALPETAHVKILVGGYPFNVCPKLWRQVGADGWAPDAAQALMTAESLLA